jgi:hypothetical protein
MTEIGTDIVWAAVAPENSPNPRKTRITSFARIDSLP